MDQERAFAKAVDDLKVESRYRIFADLERCAGRFPWALRHLPDPPRQRKSRTAA
jgi:5-aminolevulinate synthase